MTYLKLACIFLVCTIISFWGGFYAGRLYERDPGPRPRPLKVAILDNGGANLRVESKVVEPCR